MCGQISLVMQVHEFRGQEEIIAHMLGSRRHVGARVKVTHPVYEDIALRVRAAHS